MATAVRILLNWRIKKKGPKLRVATVVQDLGRKSLSKSAGEDCYGASLRQARPRKGYIAK